MKQISEQKRISPNCKECGCASDDLGYIDGLETYCQDCVLEQYEIEYNQELEDMVKESKTEEDLYE